jgi:hypothetical protein
MRRAVHFDDDTSERASEIGDVRSDRMLAAKIHSIDCTSADA